MNEIIETIRRELMRSICQADSELPTAIRDALRAAKAEGWELCKLPEPMEGVSTYDDGWNNCLDEIESLELDQPGGQRD